jgi:fido (protein-threonine AMPylation protein)
MPIYRTDEKLLCKPEEKADLEIANQSVVLSYLEYLSDRGGTRITLADILEIHKLTIQGIYPCGGRLRDVTTEITITDSALV